MLQLCKALPSVGNYKYLKKLLKEERKTKMIPGGLSYTLTIQHVHLSLIVQVTRASPA